jgi:hypothetical protein
MKPYDAAKAHDYYIRTRNLKGRRTGSRVQAPIRPSAKSPTYTVKVRGKAVKLTGRQLAEQRAYATKRIGEIKKRLSELNAKFKKMLAEAERKESKDRQKSKKAPTAADKSKAARESKQYRDKHKQKIATKKKVAEAKKPPKPEKKKLSPVAEVGKKINKTEDLLRSAVARQRALAAATKNG